MGERHVVRRGGAYYRVVAPQWFDPANAMHSKQRGGRWNPAGEFGALYLNATIRVAAANARAEHAAGLAGVAARSNAEATETASAGEELALFEEVVVGPPRARLRFAEWYPDPIPG